MIVVVETGSGMADANAYIGEDLLRAYFTADRLSKWDALDSDEKDALLVTATQFIDLSYKWIGKRKSPEQGLHWPRLGAYFPQSEKLIEGVPRAVRTAAAEAVGILLSGEVSESFFSRSEAAVKREKLGPLETEYFECKTEQRETEGTEFNLLNLILDGLYNPIPVRSGGVLTSEVIRV